MSIDRFFTFAQERYRIYLARKAGEKAPWTPDPILQRYRFCNVFREDDVITKWIAEHIRRPIAVSGSRGRMIFAMTAARFINRISSLAIIAHQLTSEKPIDWIRFRAALKDQHPLVGAAYIIKTPNGKNKLDGIIYILKFFEPYRLDSSAWVNSATIDLRHAHAALMQYPYVGSFMAYEIVTDLRHTNILNRAGDINTWANFGPGAARGLARVYDKPLSTWRHSSAKHQTEMLLLALDLLDNARFDCNWPNEWPAWEMRDVEHVLCEFDKYERVRLGQGEPKQKYKGV